LAFLFSAFLAPAADTAPASSIDKKKGVADKRNKGDDVQEHTAALSVSAQVI
jgi:hypothetical protein